MRMLRMFVLHIMALIGRLSPDKELVTLVMPYIYANKRDIRERERKSQPLKDILYIIRILEAKFPFPFVTNVQ